MRGRKLDREIVVEAMIKQRKSTQCLKFRSIIDQKMGNVVLLCD